MNETISELGIIIRSENGIVDVELLQNKNCEECTAKIFCKPKESNSKVLQFATNEILTKGDKVNISISGNSLLNISLNLYLYPLIILVLSLLISLSFLQKLNFAELYSFLVSCLFVSIYYLLFYILRKKNTNIESIVSLTKLNSLV